MSTVSIVDTESFIRFSKKRCPELRAYIIMMPMMMMAKNISLCGLGRLARFHVDYFLVLQAGSLAPPCPLRGRENNRHGTFGLRDIVHVACVALRARSCPLDTT